MIFKIIIPAVWLFLLIFNTWNIYFILPKRHQRWTKIYFFTVIITFGITFWLLKYLHSYSYWQELIYTPVMIFQFVSIPYLCMIFFIIDIVYLVTRIYRGIRFAKHFARQLMTVNFCLVLVVSYYGYKHEHNVVIEKYNLVIHKNVPDLAKMRIVMISDLHINAYRDKGRAKRYVDLVNQQKPDLILLAGDLFDSVHKMDVQNSKNGEPLRELKAKYGVFAVMGNHEYYGNYQGIEKYIDQLGIHRLEDQSILVDNKFYVLGRQDYTAKRMGIDRIPMAELIQNIDKTKPLFMMDHQPHNLSEAIDNNIDISVYGHTHNGQYFPLNLIIHQMYQLAHGYLKSGNTNLFVSSGIGEWGPQFRLGTNSEMIVMNVEFAK